MHIIDDCSQAMNELLSMGPPVYWVLGKGIAFDNVTEQNLICGGPGCNNNSLVTSLYLSSKYPELYVPTLPSLYSLDQFISYSN